MPKWEQTKSTAGRTVEMKPGYEVINTAMTIGPNVHWLGDCPTPPLAPCWAFIAKRLVEEAGQLAADDPNAVEKKCPYCGATTRIGKAQVGLLRCAGCGAAF